MHYCRDITAIDSPCRAIVLLQSWPRSPRILWCILITAICTCSAFCLHYHAFSLPSPPFRARHHLSPPLPYTRVPAAPTAAISRLPSHQVSHHHYPLLPTYTTALLPHNVLWPAYLPAFSCRSLQQRANNRGRVNIVVVVFACLQPTARMGRRAFTTFCNNSLSCILLWICADTMASSPYPSHSLLLPSPLPIHPSLCLLTLFCRMPSTLFLFLLFSIFPCLFSRILRADM